MTPEEFYKQIDGDYDDVKIRLMTDKLIDKFIRKFADDPTYDDMMESVNKNDIEASFRHSHTLKGVAANMGFTGLYKAADRLTEQLRPMKETADASLLADVTQEYNKIKQALEEYA